MTAELQHSQTERIPLAQEEVWEILANTDHINRYIGLPVIQYKNPIFGSGGAYREAKAKIGGIDLGWKEHPFDWVRPEFYAVLREYENGPVTRFYGGVRLHKRGEETDVEVFSNITPRSIIYRPVSLWLAKKAAKQLLDYTHRYLENVKKGEAFLPQALTSAPNESLLVDLQNRLLDRPHAKRQVVAKLVSHLRTAPDEEVIRMRPNALAEAWQQPRPDVLSTLFEGTIVGLLNLDWVLMCPNCRVPKDSANQLSNVGNEYHCDLCGVDYETDLEKFTELRFSVNSAVRAAIDAAYCIGGPMNTPHILAQWNVLPGETKKFEMELEDDLRMRILRLNVTADIASDIDEPESPTRADRHGWEPDVEWLDGDRVRLKVSNQSQRAAVAVVERRSWDKLALTAKEVVALPEFQRLCSSEVLAPGIEVGVRSVTLMFTDLKDSTAMYEQIGDATAFGQVRRHFDFMEEIIARHRGVIVKTIGDAVMAAFTLPEDGVRAAIEVQSEIAKFNEEQKFKLPLEIKIGLHQGPAIIMTANNHLDYFGRTVNIAARVQGESVGSDIVISDEIASQRGAMDLFEEGGWQQSRRPCQLKGIGSMELLFFENSDVTQPPAPSVHATT